LKAIILSHLHNDHAGGLEELLAAAPDLPVYVSSEHWKAFGEHPLFASIEGATPNHWPKGFSPRLIDYENRPIGPWGQSHSITSDGQIAAVDTSGHVPGHLSLVITGESDNGEPTTYVLTGDAAYGIDVLDREEPDGINANPARALETLRLIKEFGRRAEIVVLPSHDPDTPRLLAERVMYRPK
jgi:glyoxylase-like metal-dependent hydrolase (beta-lactamase superfamily II)